MANYTLSASITGNSSSFQKAVKDALSATEGLSKGSDSLGSKLAGGLKSGLSVAAGAVAGVTTALAAASVASIKVGSDFEAQMSMVQAISGATGGELESLRNQAIQLGADTAFSASEAAQGMENLAAAGFTTTEIMDAMPGLLDLAAASGEDLAMSSDIAASTLRGFGLAASDAGHVADVLAENANRTNSSVTETGEAMKYIAPLARAAGISMEETAAAIGIMANAGIQGSQAGTTLRGALSRLSKPTSDMVATMDQLGISFYDSEGKMKSLADQVGMLKEATAGMTDEQRNNALVTLYGQEALSGMLALMNEGDDSLRTLTESFKNCDGAAEKAADTMQDNLQGAVEQMKGSLETLGIVIYDKLAEPLKNLTGVATESINSLTTAFQEQGLEGLVAVGSQILTNILTGIAQALPNVVLTVQQVIQSILTNLQSNLPQLVSSGGQIIMTLITGMIQLLPQIGLFVLSLIQEIYNQITAAAPTLLMQGYQLLYNIVTGFVQNIPVVLPQILTFIQQLGEGLAAAAPTLIQKGFELLSKLVEGITTAIPILIAKAPEIISTFASAIGSNLPLILQKGLELIGQLAMGILQAIPQLIAAVPQVVSAITQVITSYDWASLGKQIITFFKNGISSMISAVTSTANNLKNNIVNALKNLPSKLMDLGKTAISNLRNAVQSGVGSISSAARNIFNGIVNAIRNLPSRLMSLAQNAVSNIRNAFTSINWGSIGSNIISGIASGIAGAVGGLVSAAINAARSAFNAAKSFLGIHSPSTLFRDEIGLNMALGMGVGFEDNIPVKDINNALDSVVNKISGHYVDVGKRISPIDAITGTARVAETYQADVSNIFEGMVIAIDNTTNLDGAPIYKKSAEYTIRQIGNQQRAVLRSKGAYA